MTNVDVSIAVYSMRGDGVANLWTASTGQTFELLPERGTFTCSIARLPLMPSLYRVNLFATVNGIIADWVTDAAMLEVADGDFFGSGRLQPSGYGSVIIDHDWSVLPDA